MRIRPGATMFTRTPAGPSSRARARVNAFSSPLAPSYAAITGLVISAPMEEITQTDPCASAMPASVGPLDQLDREPRVADDGVHEAVALDREQRSVVVQDADVRDDVGHLAEALHRAVDQPLGRRLVEHVAGDTERLVARRPRASPTGRIEVLLPRALMHHARPFGGQEPRGRQADALRRAGDDGDGVLEPARSRPQPCRPADAARGGP